MSENRTSSAPEERIAVGILRKAHGVRGEASVEPLTPSLDRFAALDRIWLVSPDEREILETRVISSRPHGERALVRFELADSPEALRRFHNWTIEIEETEARELDEDEYFLHDLIDVKVVGPDGETIGSVVQWEENGGGILLTVKRPNGKRFDLPFVNEICTEIDIEGKRIVADVPEGLIEIDRLPAIEEAEPGARGESEGLPEGAAGGEEGERKAPSAREPDSSDSGDAVEAEIRESSPAITFDLVTIFPDMFGPLLAEGILARAIKAGTIEVKVWDLREYATDRHQSTDDEAYGGGAGMVMLAEPVLRCVEAIRELRETPHVVMMSPQGRRFDQGDARELAGRRSIVLLCGRYEGFDERVREAVVDEELSIGDFVVTGGELPAMLVVDAVSRMIDGVVGQRNSVEADSFYTGLLDYPHYTRPAEVRGMRVPEVLISGHFEKIRKWRKEQSLRNTLSKRPDLLETADLDAEAERMLERIRRESSEEVVDSE